jgi:protein transport protein SEC13
VTWAHPKYGNLIATAGQDGFIKIWSEVQASGGTTEWRHSHEVDLKSAVQCISWAPWEYGLVLAAGTADGNIHLLTKKLEDTEWKPISSTEGHKRGAAF